MTMDATTESIARFIGVFELAVEDARLRKELEEFRLEQATTEEAETIVPVEVHLAAPYELKDYDPLLTYTHKPVSLGPVPVMELRLSEQILKTEVPAPPSPDQLQIDAHPFPSPQIIYQSFEVPPPSSVVAITYQRIDLQDDDLLLNGLNAPFVSTATFNTALDVLAGHAASLSVLEASAIPVGQSWGALAARIADQVAAVTIPEVDGASTALLRGEDVSGSFLNGEIVEKLPEWTDLLPKYLRPEEADAKGKGEDEATLRDMSRDFDSGGPEQEQLDGHSLVIGGNLSLNDASIGSAWLDAPVIFVSGDATRIDAISQVTVFAGDSEANVPAEAVSRVKNMAEVTVDSVPGTGSGNSDFLPEAWSVTRITGDVVQYNWLRQEIHGSDNDRAEIVVQGTASKIVLGDNQLVDTLDLVELGFSYDLIFVGGDKIDINVISQRSVLLDHDIIRSIESGDQPAISAGATADNLVLNKASLVTHGVDEYVKAVEAFAETAADLADGAATIARDVARDAMFAGKEALRVLQIDGDFATVNLLEQINIFSDSDQVYAEMAALQEQLGGQMVAGSNAIVNAARIEQHGLDSKVMVIGDVYEDAMLYQAELIEADVPEAEVKSAVPGSEAVAFLVDDMMVLEQTEEASHMHTDSQDFASVDVMQSMLA